MAFHRDHDTKIFMALPTKVVDLTKYVGEWNLGSATTLDQRFVADQSLPVTTVTGLATSLNLGGVIYDADENDELLTNDGKDAVFVRLNTKEDWISWAINAKNLDSPFVTDNGIITVSHSSVGSHHSILNRVKCGVLLPQRFNQNIATGGLRPAASKDQQVIIIVAKRGNVSKVEVSFGTSYKFDTGTINRTGIWMGTLKQGSTNIPAGRTGSWAITTTGNRNNSEIYVGYFNRTD